MWIQIDNADISKLKILPTEKPHLRYSSSDFSDEEELSKITDEIVQTVFEMIMLRNNKVFGFLESVQNLFGNMLTEVDKTNLIYSVTIPRKNYHYPQREIKQYFQLYGRTPVEKRYLPLRICMIILTAGAIGNFIDRLTRGYVVDFFYFSLIDFPIFNVADIYVTVTFIVLVLLIFFYYKDEDFSIYSRRQEQKHAD